jgi:hypothetical protein
LPFDLVDIPTHTVQTPVDVGACQPPWLADLPHQQQREQVAVRREVVNGVGHPLPSFIQINRGPCFVLAAGVVDSC